ncbi:sugar kinase, partial [bacterium]
FHTGGIFAALSETTPLVAKEAMESAKRHGVTVSYDLNYRPSLWKERGGREAADAVNATLLPYVDVLFGSSGDVPHLKTVASTKREIGSASIQRWGGSMIHEGQRYETPLRPIEVLDRIGGGDAFASGIIYGLLGGKDPQWALECGVAHGALAMTTPGDNSMATLSEVLQTMRESGSGVDR